jgi:hypothetical protein
MKQIFVRTVNVGDFIKSQEQVIDDVSVVSLDDNGVLTLRFTRDMVMTAKVVYCLRSSRALEIVLKQDEATKTSYYTLRVDTVEIPLIMSLEDMELFVEEAKQFLCTS